MGVFQMSWETFVVSALARYLSAEALTNPVSTEMKRTQFSLLRTARRREKSQWQIPGQSRFAGLG